MAELVIEEKLLYLFASKSFFEPVSRYAPARRDFHDPLMRILPKGWTLQHRNLWWDCSPAEADIPAQGWKIHLSATPAHAPAILMTVARVLFDAGVPFKFIVDRVLLTMINGKRWHRGGAGKFITAYPRDSEQCGILLQVLYQATIGYWGPYILSDRRYRDSRVVHYRYGGLLPSRRMDVSGKSVLVIQDAQGATLDDERTPYFKLPPGIEDPFQPGPTSGATDDDEAGTLKQGRYEVRSVLASSNPGGVYLAFDRATERTVVIKEARPFTNVSYRGLDAVQLLKKEHRLLSVLADTGIAPRPLDFFIDWEHAYLVEEYLQGGRTLREHLTRINLLLLTRAEQHHSHEYFGKYCRLFSQLAAAIKALHDRNIVFSDLSLANVMVHEYEDREPELKLIDFEGAYEEGVDIPTHLFTPGFTPEEAIERGQSSREDDYYALGGLLMSGLFPMNAMLVLNRRAHERYLIAYQRDFDLPESIADLIRSLLDSNPALRPGPEQVIEVLSREHQPRPPKVGADELDAIDLGKTIASMLSYIEGVADYSRSDRLFPADPMVFETNPLSLANGACGVAYVMHRIRGKVEQRVLDWIAAQPIRARSYTPGLFTGLSGIAWCLLEIGQREAALKVIGETREHPLLWKSANLFNGAAGWGMAQLKFFAATGDTAFLENARRAGQYLVDSREIDEDGDGGCFWNTSDGLSSSLGHGAAGVSLFLLYLHLATGDDHFIRTGEQGLHWVLGQGFKNPEGGLTWFARDRTPSYTPYWRWGSSGIGRVLLRYWHVTGNTRYAEALEDIHIDCDRKYTIFPGYFFGIAGIAELYLDLARFAPWKERAEHSTRKLLAGCMLFPIEQPQGLAFPGESLSRVSCDFGTGSAGIALVMQRYLQRDGASFMLDELLPDWSPVDRC
jgi:serine/threonine protein kinase